MGLRWHARAVKAGLLAEAWREPARRAELLDDDAEGPALHLDKAWDGLWFLLSPARRRWLEAQEALVLRERERLRSVYPHSLGLILVEAEAPGRWRVDTGGAAVAGMKNLFPAEDGGFCRALGQQRVVQVSRALAHHRAQDLKAVFDATVMDRLGVYPGVWLDEGEAACDWLLSSFDKLKSFYTNSARDKLSVVVWVG